VVSHFLKKKFHEQEVVSELPFYLCVCVCDHVMWVLCHSGMARPKVEDRGSGFQVWRVAAKLLNEQSWTADNGWSSILVVGRGANNSSS
jgi:hypothetical protein